MAEEDKEKMKEAAAKEAAKLVKNGMIIGVGTGSTAKHFIKALKRRIERENLELRCVCTSLESKKMLEGEIPFVSESLTDKIDITFDGADRIDESFNLIKGGGGALLREKIVAMRSKQNIVIVDSSKLTTPLEGFPVAVEIVPFGYASTINRLTHLGYAGSLRMEKNEIVRSDNHNYIYDINFEEPIYEPRKHHEKIKQVLGVIETGLFFDTATIAYVGYPDLNVKKMEKA